MEEVWKTVPGYEGLYEASTFGKVRSLPRTVYTQKTKIARRLPGLILHPMTDCDNRQQVSLCKDYKVKVIRVHKIILLTFIGPCPENQECCHNDGNASNNHLNNLRYDTGLANARDNVKHGKTNRGEKSPTSKLNANQVIEIRSSYAEGERTNQLAKRFGVGHQQISRIVKRERWAHI